MGYKIISLTNQMWFSVVCTLIDNDMRHHSSQNVVDSRGAEQILTKLRWHISLSIRVQMMLNHILICFFYHNINVKENVFLRARAERGIVTHYWCEQQCLDSHRQWQISQSDCMISSNCGKKSLSKLSLGPWSIC